ncbi:calcium-binding protein [Jannaschia sp. CCS1]|uniref:calcium-binding protein n=1 Tax=Jannaschia sp. (strain CCS1) TaxID=290400 RepID=UPI000053D7A0|nr:type I secretion target repeat-containing protein [Jannaschia sp. CCS1]ABD56948.1 type I secretion target repeat protein [Jannaschia sp. CCS1]
MIVAGSVLTLLLMGLAVDGFVNPADEEPDDDAGVQEDELDGDDQSGSGDGLTDLLDAAGNVPGELTASASAALAYTPIDQIEPDEENDLLAQAEADADEVWDMAEAEQSESDFIDIHSTTHIGDGQDVPYVATFDPETDTLVLEFLGFEEDAPDIDVAYDEDEDASIVSANGYPVTMVEGSKDMTAEHVRVVMGGADEGEDPDAQPDGTEGETGTGPDDAGAEGSSGSQAQADTADPMPLDPSDMPDTMDEASADRMNNIFNGEGEEVVSGDGDDDALTGSDGDDVMAGGAGDDTIDGGDDRDLLFGGDGDDVLMGGSDADFLHGGLGADTLDGGDGDDTLDGVVSNGSTDADEGDTLFGGDGDDHIILGRGDMAEGGAGADTFTSGSYIETAEVAGHVSDFNPTEDRIEVIFDPVESPDPTLEVHDFEDGSGADIVLDGQIILSVSGAQGLDPNMIELQARA